MRDVACHVLCWICWLCWSACRARSDQVCTGFARVCEDRPADRVSMVQHKMQDRLRVVDELARRVRFGRVQLMVMFFRSRSMQHYITPSSATVGGRQDVSIAR